jgi:addiction module HigA family antidote
MSDLPNIHPGKVLREEFLQPLGLSAYRLAKDLGVPQTRVSAILNERRGVSADTAARLARYFRTTPQFWLNVQADYDLEELARTKPRELDRIQPRRDIPADESMNG